MNLNQPTLIQFEAERRANNFIPPEGSNSFYNIGKGQINFLTKRSDPEDPRFVLYTNKGEMFTGAGTFYVSGDIKDPMHPYENLVVITGTKLSVNHILEISKGKMEVHGSLELMPNSNLVIRDGAHVTMYIDSTFIVRDTSQIIIEKGSSLTIYGEINVHLSRVDELVNVDGITIDSAAVMTVDGMELLGQRPFSFTDYDAYLRTQIINIQTQGEINQTDSRIGYTWVDGTPKNKSQLIDLSLLWGEGVLGDFKLSILGYPEKLISDLQIVRQLKINKGCTFYITESYKDKRYIRPDLYLGVIISNTKTPANLEIDGKVIVEGKNSFITVDRRSTIQLNKGGEIWLKDHSVIRSTHNNESDKLFFIDGILYIEDISQISSFEHDNIVLGDTGKVVIFNPDTGEKRLLWSTPNGIENSDLYRLFKDRIDHVEYHISNNTGIAIDRYYEFYAREFVWWYGKRRIEKAIHDGIIVWHSGGFIELNASVIPWVDERCTLLHAARIFKTFGSFDNEKLQECVERLKYAGAGNIVIRFVYPNGSHEVILNLEDINIENVYNHPMTDMYTVITNNDGQLFMRNKVTKATVDNIVSPESRVIEVKDKKAEFPL